MTLASRSSLLDSYKNPRLSSLAERTKHMLTQVGRSEAAEQAANAEMKAKNVALDRYHRFLKLRTEAMFRNTQFTGVLPATNLEKTRQAAEGGLSVFAQRKSQDDWNLGELPGPLTKDQQAQIRDGCYELFMILADVAVGQGGAQLDRGLRVLESAARLRPDHPRVYHLKKAALLAAKKDTAGADRERAEAALIPPQTAFDYFLLGQDEYKRDRWAEAIDDFKTVLRNKPDHFWARCLQAICFIQIDEYEAANANLKAALEAEPDSAWLYLLRGYAAGQQATKHSQLVASSPGRETGLKKASESEFDQAESDFARRTSCSKAIQTTTFYTSCL